MTLDESIAALVALRQELPGDTELIMSLEGWLIQGIHKHVCTEGEFPEDWNMPAGYVFVEVEHEGV